MYNNINNLYLYICMTTISKIDELVGEAFINAVRLHLDSMILCKNGSFTSAYQLAVEASQEITKALVLEGIMHQTSLGDFATGNIGLERALTQTLTNQRMLSRQTAKTIRELSKTGEQKELAYLLAKVFEQATDDQRERLTYVSLTKKNKKVDLDGKKVIPRLIGRKDKARRQITTNNDFLAVYIGGFLSESYEVSSDALAWEMSEETLEILRLEWTQIGRKAQQLLRAHEVKRTAHEEAAEVAGVTMYAADEVDGREQRSFVTSI